MDFGRYTIDDFICDETFQDYVFHSDKDHFDFWEDWTERNPHKVYEIEEARKILIRLQVKKRIKLPEDKLLDINENINRILDKKIAKNHKKEFVERKIKNHNNVFWFNRIAAAIIFMVLAVVGVYYLLGININPKEKGELVFVNKVVPKGKKLTITLSDGSVVKVNSESKIKFPKSFSEDSREVYLEGEAFFEVARNESKPFIIYSGNIKTTVLGTSFNVKAYDHNKVQVAVNSGKVKVENSSLEIEPALLIQNEMVICANEKIEFTKFVSEDYFGWKDGILFFDDANIDEVVSALERWYDVKVHIVDKNLITGEFNGLYKNKSLGVVMEGISYSSKFSYVLENKNLTIIGKP
ncbi:MAG: FecR domain-containing protein [Flammeovirgaceae bacterium]|nr:FecR domain-containing protein [Flammeovirgaceae bacterium]